LSSESLRKFNDLPFIKKVILLLLGIQLIILPIRIDNYQFLLFSLAPFIYLLANLFNADKFPLKIIPLDIAWLSFSLWGFGSILWATNSSLVWFPAFGWLTMILWMILIRSIIAEGKLVPILFTFFQSLAVLFSCYYLIFFLGKIITNRIFIDTSVGFLNQLAATLKLPIGQYQIHTNGPDFWNLIFGYNCNVTALYAVLLLPFILFANPLSNKLVNKLIKNGSIGVTIMLIFQASSIGVLLAFAAMLAYYLWNLQLTSYRKLVGVTIGIVLSIFVIIALYDVKLIVQSPIVLELHSLRDGGRYLTVIDALRIVAEKPILGSGLGNWPIDAHKNYLTDTEYLNHNFPINHVIYSLILAELGLVGFGIFISMIGYLLYSNLKEGRQIVPIKKAAFASFMVYAIALLFYNGANLHPLFFGKAQLIAFCSIGIMTYDSNKNLQLSLWHKLLVVLLSLGSFSWFAYNLITDRNYASIRKKTKIDRPEVAFNQLEKIYNPTFKTTYGRNKSISFELAKLALHQQDNQSAKKYFEQAIKENANNEDILISYAKFLLRIDGDTVNANKYITQASAIKKDNLSLDLYLVELAIGRGEYATAKKYLDRQTNLGKFRLQEKLLELKLYSSNYLGELLSLTTIQKKLLSDAELSQKPYQRSLNNYLIQAETLLAYPNKEAMIVLEEKIIERYNQMELWYFDNLSAEQFHVYLQDKYTNKLGYLLKKLSVKLDLSTEQIVQINKLFLTHRIQRKIIKLQITRAQEILPQLQQQQLTLLKEGSMQLKEILTSDQYKKYYTLPRFNTNSMDALLH